MTDRAATGGRDRVEDARGRETVLDLIGLKCPLPVLRTATALDRLAPGSALTVLTSDPLAALDLPNLLRERGDVLLSQDVGIGTSTFRIRRRG